MYSEPIPMDVNPKYLGVSLDRRLTFNHHTNVVRQKCIKLMNILKCLAYKNWSLSTNEQLTVYKLLIRSCMDYAAPLTPYMTSSSELHAKAGIESIKQRLMGLSKKYVERATKVSNALILK
jgi:hypothetical protein